MAAFTNNHRYQQLLGCTKVNLTNTTGIYARYTTTVLCNSLVQNSAQACGLNDQTARPVCADTCAEFAISEEQIAATPDLCGTTAANALNQIRADFTNCALPANSLTTSCIQGVQNEPDNCGFSDNLNSLCSYCAASSPNATDSCCLYSQTETRCKNVHLPLTTSMGNLFTSTATSTPTASATASSNKGSGLSGGAIAGIVVGSVLGAILLLALIIGCCILARRRKESQRGSDFNQRSSVRQAPGPAMSYTSSNRAPPPEILPAGARVHQMAALESTSSSNVIDHSPTAGGGFSSGYDDTPESQRSGLGVAQAPKRGGSMRTLSSPGSIGDYSSPEGLASGQSEQLSHFKDYYSHDDIRPHDTVAVLWAYQPRANDEWELERGDMIKIVGIWDDGWGTGIKMRERADEWEARRNGNRDSGVSNGSRSRPISGEAPTDGEIKAFPVSFEPAVQLLQHPLRMLAPLYFANVPCSSFAFAFRIIGGKPSKATLPTRYPLQAPAALENLMSAHLCVP